MTTVIKTAATSQQVREPTRELTADELALVIGGAPSAKGDQPMETLSLSFSKVMFTYTER
jgi:hypothetical protein